MFTNEPAWLKMFGNEPTYVIDDDTIVSIHYDESSNCMLACDINTGAVICTSQCGNNSCMKPDEIDPYNDNSYEINRFFDFEIAAI